MAGMPCCGWVAPTHRLWLKEPPATDCAALHERSNCHLDAVFERPRAGCPHSAVAELLSGACPGRGRHFRAFLSKRRQRLALALRALDGRNEGNSYRVIAEVLFGESASRERAWKTHDLRNRTIRLVQRGLALMRGGYRDLLRQVAPRRNRR